MKDIFRLVQTGDLHLGSPFTFAPNQASLLQKTQIETFWSIIRLCQEQQADALLIAGDFFDQPNPDRALVLAVCEMLNSLTHTRVLIAPGNHDPFGLDSPYRTIEWPESVTIFGEQLDYVEFADHHLRIYGIGFTATVSTRPLLADQAIDLDSDFANVLLIHGDLDGPSEQSPYNALKSADLANKGFDYVAVGHIHEFSGLKIQGQTSLAYAGCPFGRGFDETGSKGVIAGTLQLVPSRLSDLSGQKPRPFSVKISLEFAPLASRQFVDLAVDVTGLTDQQQLADHILAMMGQAGGQHFRDNLYKIRLIGALPEGFSPVLAILEQRLAGQVCYFKIRDNTRRAYQLDRLITEHSLRGAFVRQAQAKIEEARTSKDPNQLAAAELALELGLLVMQGEGITYAAD
ncbi:MAG: DNA repair exonuclease [Eubacteriales bacterium]|nr:DNA repair exonuclease [Eubacteriales bacterium]